MTAGEVPWTRLSGHPSVTGTDGIVGGGSLDAPRILGLDLAGIADCTGTSHKLLWDAANKRLSCGTDNDTTYTAGNPLVLEGNTFRIPVGGVTTEFIGDNTIKDRDVSPTAAIAWGKLNKTGSSLADLTTRSAGDLSSGTLDDARLSANVPLKDAANTFTGANTFDAPTTMASADITGDASIGGDLALTGTLISGDVPWARLSRHTSITPGHGLVGGGDLSADRTLAVDPAVLQNRVSGSCGVGSYIVAIAEEGTVTCTQAVYEVTAGAGLTGGTITQTGTLAIADGGVTTGMLADGTVHAVDVEDAEVQLRVVDACSAGTFIVAVGADGTVTCAAPDLSSAGGWKDQGTSVVLATDSDWVGVGTGTPKDKLEVRGGDVRISEDTDNVFRTAERGEVFDLIGTYAGWDPRTVYVAGYNAANSAHDPRDAEAVSVGGQSSERLWVNLTTGKVGIGTANPAETLDVRGDAAFAGSVDITSSAPEALNVKSASISGTQLTLRNTDAGGREWRLLSTGSNNEEGAGKLSVFDATATKRRMTFDANGRVGIGTTSPGATLDVNGDVRWVGDLAGGNVPWARLTSFPGGCGSGQFVTAVGGSLTCATPPDANSGGTVTQVNSGTGLTGGPITGSGTISIADGGVGSTQLADGSVTTSKFSSAANPTITGITTTGGANLATTGGSVGIGTASPGHKLDVRGGSIRAQNAGVAHLFLNNTEAGGHEYALFSSGAAQGPGLGGLGLRDQTTGRNVLKVDGAGNVGLNNDAMSVTAGGRVGIGTATPSGRLHVVTPTDDGIYLTRGGEKDVVIGIGGEHGYLRKNTTEAVQWYNDGAVRMPQQVTMATASGSVGIGTTSPTATLDVVGDTYVQRIRTASSADDASVRIALSSPASQGQVELDWVNNAARPGGGYAVLQTGKSANTPDLALLAGSVGIGTQTPGAKLDVNGNVRWVGDLAGGNVPWARLTGFPAGCGSGQFVSAVGGSLTCSTPADANSGGTVTQVNTGAGLTGGPVTSTGTIRVADDGITSAMIAAGAVGTSEISTGASPTVAGLTSTGGASVATSGGTLAVGFTGPAIAKVGILGDAVIDQSATNTAALRLTSSSAGHGSGIHLDNTASGGRKYSAYSNSDGKLVFGDETAGLVRLTVDSAGRVRIGDTGTADAKLVVGGDVAWTGGLTGGSVPWARLTGFPAGCPVEKVVTAVDQTLRCDWVTGTQVQDGSLTGDDIRSNSLGSGTYMDNSIQGSKIVDGTIKAVDVDAAEVQRRITGTCAAGNSIRAIAQDGGVTCEPDDAGASSGWVDDGAAVRLTSASDSVGIGTAGPQEKLDVRGSLILDPGSSPILYTAATGGEQNRHLRLLNSPAHQSASGLKAGGVLVADDYDYATPGKNDLVVKGDVGIGTAAPARGLHVVKTPSDGYQVARLTSDGTTGSGLGLEARAAGGRTFSLLSTANNAGAGAGKLAIYDETAGAYRMVIDSAGNVGVGTNGPGSKLTVSRTDFGAANDANVLAELRSDQHAFLKLAPGNGMSPWGIFGAGAPGEANPRLSIYRYPDGPTPAAELLTVERGGNVGIGTSDPARLLHVNGKAAFGSTAGKFVEVAPDIIQGWNGGSISDLSLQSFGGKLIVQGGGATFMGDRVGLNTLSPDANAQLTVNGNGVAVNPQNAGAEFQPWWTGGLRTHTSSDGAYFGMKAEGSGANHAAVAWGDNPEDHVKFVHVRFNGAGNPDTEHERLRIRGDGGVQLFDSGTPPCDAEHRGTLRFITGASTDNLFLCKLSGGSYVYVTVA